MCSCESLPIKCSQKQQNPSGEAGGDNATVLALVQLLQWSGGSRPASAVGYIYQQEGGNLHRWVLQHHGGVHNFVAAHSDAPLPAPVFVLEPKKPGLGPCPLASCVLAVFGADAEGSSGSAGGGMILAMGALLERQRSGQGQVIDAAMLDGANYTARTVQPAWLQPGTWSCSRSSVKLPVHTRQVGRDGHLAASDFVLCDKCPTIWLRAAWERMGGDAEWVEGSFRGNLGEVFIRCNNALYIRGMADEESDMD
eukprot:Skav223096  [mRNA]  locus=scaffold419:537488:545214:+ [translate_table: standard]